MLKWTILVGSLYYLSLSVYCGLESGIFQQFSNNNVLQLPAIVIGIAFLPLNLLLETIKWKMLVDKKELITWTEAWKGVFAGITLGMITPFQLGDLFGKATSLKKLNKRDGSITAALGSITQLFVTIIIGLCGLALLLFKLNIVNASIAILMLLLIVVFALTSIYGLGAIPNLVFKIKSEKWKSLLQILNAYSKLLINRLVLLSFLRYVVFSTQFFLFALFFQIRIDWPLLIACITVVLLIQGLFPSFILIEFGIRGSVALFVFGLFTIQLQEILATTYCLWFLNKCIPGIIGWFILSKYKVIP